MKSIHVLRKPCSRSAPTVAANVLRYGTGALNIGATRIKHVLVAGGSLDLNPHLRQGIKRGQSLNPTAFALGDNATGSVDPAGRWPANLILQHLDGCVQDGVKKVKVIGATAHQKDHKTHSWVAEGTQTHEHAGFRDPDGTETVTAWTCAEGCPVAALDASGRTSVTGRRSDNSANAEVKGTNWGPTNHKSCEYPNDKGGASRFFKQVGGMVTLSGGGRGRTG